MDSLKEVFWALVLFLCYLNDMELSISPEIKLLLFADDSAILYSHKDSRVISKKLGSELEICSKWLIDYFFFCRGGVGGGGVGVGGGGVGLQPFQEYLTYMYRYIK